MPMVSPHMIRMLLYAGQRDPDRQRDESPNSHHLFVAARALSSLATPDPASPTHVLRRDHPSSGLHARFAQRALASAAKAKPGYSWERTATRRAGPTSHAVKSSVLDRQGTLSQGIRKEGDSAPGPQPEDDAVMRRGRPVRMLLQMQHPSQNRPAGPRLYRVGSGLRAGNPTLHARRNRARERITQ
jgi:hypothetical protein